MNLENADRLLNRLFNDDFVVSKGFDLIHGYMGGRSHVGVVYFDKSIRLGDIRQTIKRGLLFEFTDYKGEKFLFDRHCEIYLTEKMYYQGDCRKFECLFKDIIVEYMMKN